MTARSSSGTARRPGRPVGADAAQTRERILQAAYEVINERGYAATTFQEIAKRSGLSRPTLNYYFASREDLYRALLQQAHDVVTSCIHAAKQHEGSLNRLRAYIDAVVAVWHRDHAVVGFLATARLEAYRHPDLPSATVAATRGFSVNWSPKRSIDVNCRRTPNRRVWSSCCTRCCGESAPTAVGRAGP
ncbi:TetR family transcriptional regulator [Mycolicibacterium fortuitum]|uniref:TetR family transcriptional regulator n=1 Tax=Mycolicibacterium fortuitum TaxID=1766 RepID=A0A378UBC4_MYCFO|nr:TetR family transcriptional regulator [Mycolicibacterium fortuitum]